jgi:hypothetical protein
LSVSAGVLSADVQGGGSGSSGPPGFQTLTDEADIAWDLSLGSARVTLAGNRTLSNPTNLGAGEHYFLSVVQDDSGGRTLAYGNVYKFSSNIPPVLSTYKNREDIIQFESDGTNLFCIGIIKNLTNATPVLEYLTNLLLWFKADSEVYSDNGVT